MSWTKSWNKQIYDNTYIVQESQTIQSVIDSCSNPTADNLFEVLVPPGHEDVSYTPEAYVSVSRAGRRESIFTIAANNSLYKHTADLICDGTDDDVQLQTAIDAIYDLAPVGFTAIGPGGKGSVALMGGAYYFGSPVEMRPGISLKGTAMGPDVYLVTGNGMNDDMFQFTENAVNPSAGFVLENLFCDGNQGNQSVETSAVNSKTGTYAMWDLQIRNCFFFSFKGTVLKILDPWGFRMVNSQIEDSLSYAIEMVGSSAKTDGAIIMNNKIIQNGKGCKFTDVDGTILVGNELNTTGVGEYAVEVTSAGLGRGHGNIISNNKSMYGTNGINIGAGCISNIVTQNAFIDLSGTEISDSGTNTVQQGNIGSGTALIDKIKNNVRMANGLAVNLNEYADNAAALTAGLVAGDFYRTGDASKVVH